MLKLEDLENNPSVVRERCYLVAKRFLQREDAEDAAQDAFIKVLRAKESYDPNKSFNSWISSIAARTAIDIGRAISISRRRTPISISSFIDGTEIKCADAFTFPEI